MEAMEVLVAFAFGIAGVDDAAQQAHATAFVPGDAPAPVTPIPFRILEHGLTVERKDEAILNMKYGLNENCGDGRRR